MHIRENIDLPRQKPQQLPSAEASFEGCISIFYQWSAHNLCSVLLFNTTAEYFSQQHQKGDNQMP